MSLTWGPDWADGGDEIQQETVGHIQEPEVTTPGDNTHWFLIEEINILTVDRMVIGST